MTKKLCTPDPEDPEHEKCIHVDKDFSKIIYSYYMLYKIDKSR